MSAALLAIALAAIGPAETATTAALARIAAIDPRVNAVIALEPDARAQARALDRGRRARGALLGMPLLLKDNIEAAGPLPTTAGSLALADNVTGRDAPLVARLRAAGAVILGKTNLSEWANMRSSASISGWSAVGGQSRSPYALDRDPCGSSAGSGAAVAAGMVPAAIGTETDGSITCPASVNGIVGLKPTVGLVSRAGIVPISHGQDTAGPLARDVRTAALVLAAIAGTDPADPATHDADAHRADYAAALRPDALKGARIGVLRFAAGFSAPVDAVFARALDLLRARGATLVEIAAFDRDGLGEAETTVLQTDFKPDLAAYLATTPAKVRGLADVIAFDEAHPAELALFGHETLVASEKTRGPDDPAYKAAQALIARKARGGLDALFAGRHLDALVAPTMGPAFLIDAVNGDAFAGGGAGSLAATAGTPHLSVPMGQVKGLPVGLSLLGPAWSEARLLALGYAYEQARGPLPGPRFLPSIEGSPEIAPLLSRAPSVAAR